MRSMEARFIHHRPRRLDATHIRLREIGQDVTASPDGLPEGEIGCPDCGCLMMYRGVGWLRNGRLVHVYECVHSPREVYSLSVVIPED